MQKLQTKLLKKIAVLTLIVLFLPIYCGKTQNANASERMPFSYLSVDTLVLRSSFYTSYSSSTEERKSNIKLASKSLNGFFLDRGNEFSFNKVVGARTIARGYKQAKIIVQGEFVEGVGGGVCQVSTTLYNAVILAGLKVTEYHPHSLPVRYVMSSFDAMVNSGSADLRFVNNTLSPIYIKTYADDDMVKVEIYGSAMREKYVRKSRVLEIIPAPEEEIIVDEKGEYPFLRKGERKVLSYSKEGLVSEGVLVKVIDGKIISSNRIRKDRYNAQKGKIIEGVFEYEP